MNDEQDPQLDPEQEERVRALLADLGSAPDAAAMPPEVAARLDDTLAGLVAERAEAEEPSNVVPLRRRWAPRAAAAAAAVIVVGAGGVAAANLGLFGGAMTASDKASSGSGGGQAESLDSGSGTAAPSVPGAASGDLAAGLPRVSAASFDADVARLLRRTTTQQESAASGRTSQDRSAAKSFAASCPGPKVSNGSTTTPVLYDGTAVALVVHPEQGGRELVEAWTCAGDHVLDRTHVKAVHATSGQSSPGSPGLGSPSPTP